MATENGPCCMYKLKPIYNSSELIELPTNMYSLPTFYESVVSGNEENEEFIQFEEQQIEVLKKLKSLDAKLKEMKKEIDIEYGTPCSMEATQKLFNSIPQIINGVLLSLGNVVRGITKYYSELLKIKVNKCQDIVINANPNYPPFSVWVLCHLLQKQTSVMLNMHIHSTVTDFPHYLSHLREEESTHLRTSHEIVITLIWKEIGKDPELMINPLLQTAIISEVNIARYLARLLKPPYDEGNPEISTEIDTWLDAAHSSLLYGNTKERQSTLWSMNSHLALHKYLVGNSMTVADIVTWSALCQTKLTTNLPENVAKWWSSLYSTGAFLLPERFL